MKRKNSPFLTSSMRFDHSFGPRSCRIALSDRSLPAQFGSMLNENVAASGLTVLGKSIAVPSVILMPWPSSASSTF
jgi:hypothetical protein